MATTSKVVDGKIEITKVGDTVITTMDLKEVIGKKAEAQTKVDHLNIDLAEAQAVVTEYDDMIKELEK